jgi:hypothetical protein
MCICRKARGTDWYPDSWSNEQLEKDIIDSMGERIYADKGDSRMGKCVTKVKV